MVGVKLQCFDIKGGEKKKQTIVRVVTAAVSIQPVW